MPAKGTVSLDGKPMPDGEISFETTGFPPVALPVKDGAFSGEVKEGKNKVAIRVYKEGKPLSTDPNGPPIKQNILPERYAGQTTLTADLPPVGSTNLSFNVTSK
ncbi:hypothetical protein FRUB_00364 [Fimbriiglobus ruber]|uniref:Uncharacterized protein n=1 Tax=Fimbriiglobus ruber TaxID=1908690 RepID=A0A225EE48_9BACT|nr:hypothetical protein FRUB_00364 [Fimbriiglobus ruber]